MRKLACFLSLGLIVFLIQWTSSGVLRFSVDVSVPEEFEESFDDGPVVGDRLWGVTPIVELHHELLDVLSLGAGETHPQVFGDSLQVVGLFGEPADTDALRLELI